MVVSLKECSVLLKAGYVVGVPTDTVYGLASIDKYSYKIYNIKGRNKNKKLITMINDKNIFSHIDKKLYKKMIEKWPGNTTVIFEEFGKLNSYRIPNEENLLNLLSLTGPLVTTSANSSGKAPCLTKEEFLQTFPNIPLLEEKQKTKKLSKPSDILLYNRGKFKKIR